MDYDSDSADFCTESTLKARKEHKCCECRGVIVKGRTYERAAGKTCGEMWSYATCAACAEIRDAFVCGSWVYGQLWESIEESMFPVWTRKGPIDCLAKLETLEAREKCRDRYRDWKADREVE
jgi:hypothetical protein